MPDNSKVWVRVRHGSDEVEFEGDRDTVWALLNKYFAEKLGVLEVVSKLTPTPDIVKLAEMLAGHVVFENNTIDVLFQGETKKRILLCLAGAYVGKRLGLLNEDKLGPKTIAGILRIDERVARARLSELWKEGVVERDDEGRYLFKPSKMSSLLEGWGL